MFRKIFRWFWILLCLWGVGVIIYVMDTFETTTHTNPVTQGRAGQRNLHLNTNLFNSSLNIYQDTKNENNATSPKIVKLQSIRKSYLINKTLETKTEQAELHGTVKLIPRGTRFNDERAHAIRHEKQEVEQRYYTLGSVKVNPIESKFIIMNRHLCDKIIPYLLILVPSLHGHFPVRNAIRQTYGSFANKSNILGGKHSNVSVKLLFLFGKGRTEYEDLIIRNESQKHGDIVQADFKESYYNLTRKILIGLKWASIYCGEVDHVLKVDEDVFVNIPLLLEQLFSKPYGIKGAIYGYMNSGSSVKRLGKWAVSKSQYPLTHYPVYASGNSYVISGNIISRLFAVAEYLPYMPIEDAFITGCLAKVVGAKHIGVDGFTFWLENIPDACNFFKKKRLSATKVTVGHMYKLWKTFHSYDEMCKKGNNQLSV